MTIRPALRLAAAIALALSLGACADAGPSAEGGGGGGDTGQDGAGGRDLARDASDAPEDPGPDAVADTGSDADAGGIGDADLGADGDMGFDTGADTGLSDALDTGADADVDAGSRCPWAIPTSADERVVLVGHAHSDEPLVPGIEVRGLTLDASGTLHDDGERLTLMDSPRRIAFAPSGELAFVLGEDGVLASVAVHGADDLEMIDFVELPSSADRDLRFDPERGLLHVVAFNSQPDGGVYVVEVDCEGNLRNNGDHFISMRLSDSLVLGPEPDQAILLGGQAVFEPVDDDDFRLLRWSDEDGWSEEASFDIFSAFIETSRMALSPDGTTLLVPNASIDPVEANLVLVLDVKPDSLAEVTRLTGLETPTETLFAAEGSTALVTLFEPGAVAVLHDAGEGWAEVDRLRGIGLADQMAAVRNGSNAETVLVTSIDACEECEPNIVTLHFDSPGVAVYDGQLDLGAGIENIPSCIGVAP